MSTEFLQYENLTWPEVAALPRDTPLIIPLGTGYPLDRLAEALGHPQRAGLLPAIPYGWRGSGLAVAESLLGVLLANLLDSLRDDGFSRTFALTPPGLFEPNGTPFQAARITLPGPAASPPDGLLADEERHKVILLPVGHTEQHGYHLPLNTDTLIIDAIAGEVVQAVPQRAAALPAFPYGVSTHRSAFAGTLNAGGRAFEDFWLAVIEALVRRGFDRFYLISGHGGNHSFLVNVVKYAGERHPRTFAATTWLHTSDRIGLQALQKYRRSGIGGMGHAGELETAMILHLRPELVHMDRCVDETKFIATASYYMDWAEGGALVANPPWQDDTATGAYGAGSLANAENGARWLQAAVAEKVDHVNQIDEQQRRREEKREAAAASGPK